VPQWYLNFFHIYSDIQDSLKLLSTVVPISKFRSIDVIMKSHLQKLRDIFCQADFTLLLSAAVVVGAEVSNFKAEYIKQASYEYNF